MSKHSDQSNKQFPFRKFATMGEVERKLMEERDPNGIDPQAGGAKLDADKSPVFQGLVDYFPRACLEVAKVSKRGAEKYSWKGFETVPDGPTRYANALVRHLLLEGIEGPYDKDTGLLHTAQEAWNALARLELILREQEKSIEDGPKPGEWVAVTGDQATMFRMKP